MSTPRGRLEDGETLRQFVQRLSEGIYVTNRAGQVLAGNPALLEILGVRSAEDLHRIRVAELWVDPAERERQAALLAERGAVREFEFELRRADGSSRTVLDTCYQVQDPESGEALYHGILVDITERKRLERALFESSRRDALTGCLNRRFLDEFAARYESTATPWGAVVVDILGFKSFNDRYGHAVGDQVLCRVAGFLLGMVRGEDHVVRLGGDEFVVLLAGRDAEGTLEVARRIAEDADLGVRMSAGWAVREGSETVERTIARADRDLLLRRASDRELPRGGGRARSSTPPASSS